MERRARLVRGMYIYIYLSTRLGVTDNDDLGGDDGDFDYYAVVAPLLVLSSCVCVCVSSSVSLVCPESSP